MPKPFVRTARLLFVAGAGWTGNTPAAEPMCPKPNFFSRILCAIPPPFLSGSKSLDDQSRENRRIFAFIAQLRQVGETGFHTAASERSFYLCCHGEEPHLLGWRFIAPEREC